MMQPCNWTNHPFVLVLAVSVIEHGLNDILLPFFFFFLYNVAIREVRYDVPVTF